ncbi:hypothetical protein [Brucella pituitosa]|uniref:hypothetical protein n=1 Tax=Brucella pituitosa TaxID=571256 RepID=UPI0013E34A33|nr:hypothetical protein [Brucella pituitosa]
MSKWRPLNIENTLQPRDPKALIAIIDEKIPGYAGLRPPLVDGDQLIREYDICKVGNPRLRTTMTHLRPDYGYGTSPGPSLPIGLIRESGKTVGVCARQQSSHSLQAFGYMLEIRNQRSDNRSNCNQSVAFLATIPFTFAVA